MLGAVAGDIIGSPFQWNNTDDMYFELCRSTRGEFRGREVSFHPKFTEGTLMTVAVARWLMQDKEHDKRGLIREMAAMYNSYPQADYGPRFKGWLQSEYHKPYYSLGNGSAMRVSPVGLYFDDLADVMRYSAISAEVTHNHPDGIKGAQAIAQAVWMAYHGRTKDDIRFAMEHDFGYDLNRPAEEMHLLLRGCKPEPIIVNGTDTGNVYYRETGHMDTTCELSVTAALMAFMASDGFENAVRRAVTMGGDSRTIAAICGSIAEPFYGGVPAKIENLCDRFLDSTLRSSINSFAQIHDRKNVETAKIEKPKDDAFTVIRVKGGFPTFVVASYRKELIAAIRAKFGEDVEIIKPSKMQHTLDLLSKQTKVGTYLEYPRPDVRVLFYQEGEFRSGVTCSHPKAAPRDEREAAFRRFNELKEYAESVKRELQLRCGYSGDGDIHFESAFYPVVYHDRIEIREGDFLAGAVSFNPLSASIRIAEDGDLHDGEYQDADWCRERVFNSSMMDINDIKAAIGRFCLDDGVGIGRDRKSNIDTANNDIVKSSDERLIAAIDSGQKQARSTGPRM